LVVLAFLASAPDPAEWSAPDWGEERDPHREEEPAPELAQKPAIRRPVVTFDDQEVVYRRPDGWEEGIRWDELEHVTIVTTDEGPFLDDVFFHLEGAGGRERCVVPSETEGMDRLLYRFQQLPGFDNDAVISAMTSTENATFRAWTRT
jgi:hypothetical protein